MWLSLRVFLSIVGNLVAQQGYNYPFPGRPFSGATATTPSTPGGGYPSETSEPQETASTQGPAGYPGPGTQFPQGPQGTTNGYSGPGNQGLSPSFRPFPNSQQGSYPNAPSESLTGTQHQNGYPAPAKPAQPSSKYPTTNGQGGFPGAQNEYPGSSNQPGTQDGYSTTPGRPGIFSGTNGQPGTYPGTGQTGSFSGSEKPSGFTGQEGDFPGPAGGFPQLGPEEGQYEEGDYSAIPGQPDRDYPILSYIPGTSFKCDQQQFPGYYADLETRCQVFHVCANNRTFDFLCPNGTVFHQEYLVCVWWNQFDCNSAPSLYGINANIYDYSIFGAQQAQGGYQSNQGTQGGYPQEGFSTETTRGPVTEHGPAVSTGGYPGGRPQRPSGYPIDGVPTGPGSDTAYPGGRPQGTGSPTGQVGDSGYPGGRPQGPRFPTVQGGESGYPGGKPQVPQFPTGSGYTGGKPQGLGFTTRPNGVQQTERPIASGGYPSGGPQNGYHSDRPAGQQPGAYPGSTGFPNQGQQNGYPGRQPQRPSFPSSTPGTGTQRPTGPPENGGGYPSGANGGQRPSYPSQGSTNGYPSGRPQGPGFPSTPQQNGGYQRPNGQETQQGVYPQGFGYPTTIQPSTGVAATQESVGNGYPSGRPDTPFPGPSGLQQPTREYLPPF